MLRGKCTKALDIKKVVANSKMVNRGGGAVG